MHGLPEGGGGMGLRDFQVDEEQKILSTLAMVLESTFSC